MLQYSIVLLSDISMKQGDLVRPALEPNDPYIYEGEVLEKYKKKEDFKCSMNN